eukprot:2978844-Prymnesium_polylepis.1
MLDVRVCQFQLGPSAYVSAAAAVRVHRVELRRVVRASRLRRSKGARQGASPNIKAAYPQRTACERAVVGEGAVVHGNDSAVRARQGPAELGSPPEAQMPPPMGALFSLSVQPSMFAPGVSPATARPGEKPRWSPSIRSPPPS